MTRKTKDERLKLDKFPPLTGAQKAKLADALFEIEKRLRQGTYPADEVIADLQKGNNADKPDPQLYQARKLLEQMRDDDFQKLLKYLEYYEVTGDVTNAAWRIRVWLADNGTKKEDLLLYAALVDALLLMSFSPSPEPDLPECVALKELVDRITEVDKDLGAAYFSRLSRDLYDRVQQGESEKHEGLNRFVERVSKAAMTWRDKNLVMAYFNLAMQLHRPIDAARIVSDAPWRFAHERVEAYYRLFLAGHITANMRVIDPMERGLLCALRDLCLPHFRFTAACQVAEMTGEAEDLGFCHSHSLTDDQIRLMARAFLACYRDPDHREGETTHNHSRMIESWTMFVERAFQNRTWECLCLDDPILAERFKALFAIEAYKWESLSFGELYEFAIDSKRLYLKTMRSPANVALVAEAFGDPVHGTILLERAYALAQDEKLPIEERITALCRIAKLKKKFAAGNGKTE